MAATGEGTAKGRRRDGEERACDAEGEERMHRRGGRVGRKREGGGPRGRGRGRGASGFARSFALGKQNRKTEGWRLAA